MIAADPAAVIAAACGWLGTPYHDQASIRGIGCDCLGLVRGVWREVVGPEPLPLPPYSRDWGETGAREPLAEGARAIMFEIPVTEIARGALVLFRMRTGAVAKHCGILVVPDRFIHAYERTGVIEEPLTAAWRRRVAFAFLFPGEGEATMGLRAQAPETCLVAGRSVASAALDPLRRLGQEIIRERQQTLNPRVTQTV
jgi:NlpC/P60 family putative phage cell wall peptidase